MKQRPKSLGRGGLAFVLALTAGSPGHAQDLQAFNLNDFLDPRLLEAVREEGEGRVKFLSSRYTIGFLDGYQRRDQLTETGFTVARAAGSLFWGRWQLNLEATSFDRLGRDSDRIGEIRYEIARYFMSDDPDSGEEIPGRILLSWRTTSGEERGFEDEISLVFDLALFHISETPVFGGYSLTYVPETGDLFLSYVFRNTLRKWPNGIWLEAGLGLGTEYADGSVQWGHSRLELSLVFPVPIFNSYLHLLAAPYYHANPRPGASSSGTEIGLFFDAAGFSRVFRGAPRSGVR